jgi:hypothetical protein
LKFTSQRISGRDVVVNRLLDVTDLLRVVANFLPVVAHFLWVLGHLPGDVGHFLRGVGHLLRDVGSISLREESLLAKYRFITSSASMGVVVGVLSTPLTDAKRDGRSFPRA